MQIRASEGTLLLLVLLFPFSIQNSLIQHSKGTLLPL
jgi:hypothetical protein